MEAKGREGQYPTADTRTMEGGAPFLDMEQR